MALRCADANLQLAAGTLEQTRRREIRFVVRVEDLLQTNERKGSVRAFLKSHPDDIRRAAAGAVA